MNLYALKQRTANSDVSQRRIQWNAGARTGAEVGTFAESRFRHDFSRVRVQAGTGAAEAAESIGARAFAVEPQASSSAESCNGKPYDPATQCCEKQGILPKKPISNLADCPRRTADPTHKPSSNGCTMVPNNPNKLFGDDSFSCALAGQAPSFVTACDYHDICYDTCKMPKNTCDLGFYEKMMNLCQPVTNEQCRRNCESNAAAYYAGVSAFDSFYEDAQKAACKCCP